MIGVVGDEPDGLEPFGTGDTDVGVGPDTAGTEVVVDDVVDERGGLLV